MRDPVEKAKWELQCYGCYAKELDRMADNALSGGRMMLAMSILSDAQHLISPEHNMKDGDVSKANAETARQYMNRAKYLMSEFHKDERALQDAIPGMNEALDRLGKLSIFAKQAD